MSLFSRIAGAVSRDVKLTLEVPATYRYDDPAIKGVAHLENRTDEVLAVEALEVWLYDRSDELSVHPREPRVAVQLALELPAHGTLAVPFSVELSAEAVVDALDQAGVEVPEFARNLAGLVTTLQGFADDDGGEQWLDVRLSIGGRSVRYRQIVQRYGRGETGFRLSS